MKTLRQRWLHLLPEGRPHHQSDHEQVQEKHGRLADTVSFVAFVFRETSPSDQRCSHDELHDEVEICPESCAGAEKALHGRHIQHRWSSTAPADFRFSIAGKLFRPNIVFIYPHLSKRAARRRDHRWWPSYVIDRAPYDSYLCEKHFRADVSSLPCPSSVIVRDAGESGVPFFSEVFV